MTTLEVLSMLGVGRRRPDDSFFSEGDRVCQANRRLGVFDVDDELLCHKVVERFDCSIPGCPETFDSLFYFDLHYNSVHRFICAECSKQLPSPHFLDLHVSEHHDSYFLVQAERKPMYRCFVEQCDVVSMNATQRRQHCLADHKFPHDFRFDKAPRHKADTQKQPSASVTEKMEVEIKKKKKKHKSKKASDVTQEMDMCSSSSSSQLDVKMVEEGNGDEDSKKVPQKFKEFSFGRGGRGRRGGFHWFQRRATTPRPSSLETTMVDDLRASLPEPSMEVL